MGALETFRGLLVGVVCLSDVSPGPQYFTARLDCDLIAVEWVERYRGAIRSGVKLDPIIVDARFFIIDGHHRWRAHVLEKCETIRVAISPTGRWPV